MFYGQFVSGSVYLTTDGSGLPIREAAEPNPGAGYHTVLSYEQHDGAIWQVWTLVPDEGTPQDAALMLAQIQAAALSDDDALKVPALYPLYACGHVYAQGDRVLWQGALYKAISGHTATAADRSRVGQRQVLRQGRPRHQVRPGLRVADGRQHNRAGHVRQRVCMEAADGLVGACEWKN